MLKDIALLLAGFFLKVIWDWSTERFTEPKLQVDFFEEKKGYKTNAKYVDKDGKSIDDIFLRARVRNTGKKTAKGVRVFLTSLEIVHASGKTSPASLRDNMLLSWPNWIFTPRDIPPAETIQFWIDIVKFSKHPPGGWEFRAEGLSSQEELKKFKGTYRVEVTATAENAKPIPFKVDIYYPGDHTQLRAVAVK